MPLVIGIDEAGYGPLLGPLLVASSVWRMERAKWQHDLWELLSDCVCRPGRGGDYRVVVGDSKEAFDRKKGIATLERTVLAFAAATGKRCESMEALLTALGVTGLSAASAPWYRDLSTPLPFDPVHSKYDTVAARLQSAMADNGARCIALLAEVVPEDQYNDRVAQTNSKAAVLVERVLRLMQRGANLADGEDVLIRVDRLGGRMDYRAMLLRSFGERALRVVEESPDCSRYRLSDGRNTWYVEFTVEADSRHLPVGLASMVAKYVRESLMLGFNAFWREHLPDVKPTAGYYKDALRFIDAIRPVMAEAGLAPERFIRSR